MVLYPALGSFAVAFVVFGVLATLVAVSILVDFFLSNRRDRLAHHESMRTHYRRLVLTH